LNWGIEKAMLKALNAPFCKRLQKQKKPVKHSLNRLNDIIKQQVKKLLA